MTDLIPTLVDTPAVVRDRAIAEANQMRQENAELRRALSIVRSQLLLRRRDKKTLAWIDRLIAGKAP